MKAEELSEKYRDFRKQCGVKDPIMLNEIEEAYYEGYLQAEKDLELTWEDIEAIDQIFTDVFKDGFDVITDSYYQEVLNRFNKQKDKL